jgi:probable addiction module antidote protein
VLELRQTEAFRRWRLSLRMMIKKLIAYDPAEDLVSAEAIAVFLTEAFRTEDAGYIAHALGVVARAKGMAEIASRTGLSRVQLYRSFSTAGNPRLKTILAVMSALGVELSARPPARRPSRSPRQGKRAA